MVEQAACVDLLLDAGTDLGNTGGEPGLVQRRVAELRTKRSRGQAA